MIIEKNSIDIPDYLNKEFFESVLSSDLNCQNVEIKSLNFTLGSESGDNYCSLIYRVEVLYIQENSSPKQIFLIIKSIPYNGHREVFKNLEVFSKEKYMYLDILPRIEDCLDGTQVAPKCYYTTSEPIDTIVFEDMNASGYSVANRVTGLDEEHCKLVLNKLGQYHAASMLVLDKDSSIRNSGLLQQGIFATVDTRKELSEGLIVQTLHALIDHSSKWSGYENIANKLRNLVGTEFIKRTLRSMDTETSDIVVVSHGDLWVNNILFKYTDNYATPIDVVLIDFQGSFCGSVGIDLNYFFGTSPKLDVLVERRHELIENCYYASFRKALETGGYENIPSLDDVKNEIKKKAFYGFFSTILILPIISMDKKDSAHNNIEDFHDKELSAKQSTIACSSERYLETMKYLLKKFDAIGLLD